MGKIGVDIVKNNRIKLNDNFIAKVLSSDEISILETKPNKQSKINFIAGRWAVKEAIWKVLNTNKKIAFSKINIAYDNERPTITNEELRNIAISISHEDDFSIGMAVSGSD